jgi:F-type H+-transporting ATPase subunit delta
MAAVDLRYARALAAVVADQKLDIAAVQGELGDFAATLAAAADLREVLQNPSIPEPQKLRLLDAIAARAKMSKVVRNFIALLARHERLHELGEMTADFAALVDEESHVTDAEIVSARPLDAAGRKLLEKQIAGLTGGRKVRATYSEDASLLGGAVVRIGSTVYDGSVRAQLRQLRQSMVTAA